MNMDFKGNKGFRMLHLYERLSKGALLSKSNLAREYGVSEKTIQRDIDDLRVYFAEVHLDEPDLSILYDKARNGYHLVRHEQTWLTGQEILALCKILLESRALRQDEIRPIIAKLMAQASEDNQASMREVIQNELHNYVPLRHNKKLLQPIWEISQLILHHEITELSYIRKDDVRKVHLVKPVALLFSEYYFYLIAYMADGTKEYPTIFRIDRITHMKGIGETFYVPYRDKFNDGEFRKRVQFMYSGALRRVTFLYRGPSVEAVLDRLPTAEILEARDGVYTIRAEVFGDGIDMWLRSQGNNVKVLE